MFWKNMNTNHSYLQIIRNKFYSNLFYSSLGNYATPVTMSFFFNFSILLSIFLGIQIFTGMFLAMHYLPGSSTSFISIHMLDYDSQLSYLFQSMHQVSASFFVFFMLIHVSRSMYYSSSIIKLNVWIVSCLILLLTFATSFFSYILPYSQMSFWGATVITNLMSVIPFISSSMVTWVWSSFLVSSPTINRFFILHFLLPFIILLLVLLHLFMVHDSSSSKKTMYSLKIPFGPFYIFKDMFVVFSFLSLFFYVLFYYNSFTNDPENFNMANPTKTPLHIKPEWYFLFSYAILRCIPNKTLSVIALVFSLLIPLFFLFSKNPGVMKMSIFTLNFFMLTFLSSSKIEFPYLIMSQFFGIFYFLMILL